jgi:hypothetical protein
MERKHLESPELRAQHILALHRTVADLRAQLRIQEELAALGGHRTEEAAGTFVMCLTIQTFRALQLFVDGWSVLLQAR